jgi:hypothetical protein
VMDGDVLVELWSCAGSCEMTITAVLTRSLTESLTAL